MKPRNLPDIQGAAVESSSTAQLIDFLNLSEPNEPGENNEKQNKLLRTRYEGEVHKVRVLIKELKQQSVARDQSISDMKQQLAVAKRLVLSGKRDAAKSMLLKLNNQRAQVQEMVPNLPPNFSSIFEEHIIPCLPIMEELNKILSSFEPGLIVINEHAIKVKESTVLVLREFTAQDPNLENIKQALMLMKLSCMAVPELPELKETDEYSDIKDKSIKIAVAMARGIKKLELALEEQVTINKLCK